MKPFLIFAAMAPLLVALEAIGAQDLTVDETYRIAIAEDRTKAEEYGAIPQSTLIGPEGGRVLVNRTLELIESLWDEED